MEESHSFVPLLIVVLLAFVVPLVLTRFKRLSLPVVVGETLAGVIIGNSGLQLVGHDEILEILALLGFAYLMFLSGLEVDFDAIIIRRNGDVIYPHGHTVLRIGDRLTLVGSLEAVRELARRCE